MKEVKLFFQEGNSDKVYYARVVPAGAAVYDVVVQWGRRGSTLSQGKKAVKVSLEKAQATLDRLVREKLNKGYEAMSGTVKPAEVAPPMGEGSGSKATGVRKRVGRVAQLLNPVEGHEVERLLSDERVVAQQKLDGNRVLCHLVDGEVLPTNRAGQKTSVSARVLEGLAHLPSGTVVDGEVVRHDEGEVYWLFDVLEFAGEDVTGASYEERFTRLTDELEPGLVEPVRVLETAQTSAQKRALYERLQQRGAEGIVFKRKDAQYTPGRLRRGARSSSASSSAPPTWCWWRTPATPTACRSTRTAARATWARSSRAPPTSSARSSTPRWRAASARSPRCGTCTPPTTSTSSSRCSCGCATTRPSTTATSRSSKAPTGRWSRPTRSHFAAALRARARVSSSTAGTKGFWSTATSLSAVPRRRRSSSL